MEPAASTSHLVETRTLRGFQPWRQFVNDNFPWLRIASPRDDDFHARVRLTSLGERSVAVIRADQCQLTRTDYAIKRAETGYLKVMWQQAGRMLVEQDGHRTVLRPGDITVCDTSRPYRLEKDHQAQLTVLTLPYHAVPGWHQISDRLCGRSLSDRTTARAALAALLALLERPGDGDSAQTIFQAVQLMLSALIHCSVRPAGQASPTLRLDTAHQHVLAHIDDPHLSPDELAEALHVSRRALYRLFQEHQVTPGRFIRQVRLDAVRDALALPDNDHRSILEVALDYGFTDSASFSRSFKAAFAISPSDWRLQARGRHS
ncbi:MAG: helix-turn-helix domain-containing protein [Alcanivorax sp.]|nr:helix-turn-helix domain-containing protein [Alcanivorax sp.]